MGAWETERAAAIARDRAALYYGGSSIRLNFPTAGLKPADVPTLRGEARARFKKGTTSRYLGVTWIATRGRWHVSIRHNGLEEVLGYWDDEIKAAEAHDRVARFLAVADDRLNFPHRRLQAMAPSEIRRRAYRERESARKSSKYRGVFFLPKGGQRCWVAQLPAWLRRRGVPWAGHWATEEDAARAFDRAIRFYSGPRAALNFPQERLRAADAATLIAAAHREWKLTRSSQYLGVWANRSGGWVVAISRGGQRYRLGTFSDERAAAEAYDSKAIALYGVVARLNFHPDTRKQIWGKRLSALLRSKRGARART